MNQFKVELFGNKEVWVSYTKDNGTSMKLYGTYKTTDEKTNVEDYKHYIINKLKNTIQASKFFNS